jgi:hypothetical protein
MDDTAEFGYLRNSASKYGTLYNASEIERFINQISDAQLAELRAAHGAILSKHGAFAISRWIDECGEKYGQISKLDFEFSRQVGQLLNLFHHLARRGIEPFTSDDLSYVPKTTKPDWQSFPGELSYLIEVAEAFSAHSSESEWHEFLSRAHPSDLKMLVTSAERMRVNRHLPLLNQWIDEHPMDKNPAAWMLYSMLGLMDHAALNFEPLEPT